MVTAPPPKSDPTFKVNDRVEIKPSNSYAISINAPKLSKRPKRSKLGTITEVKTVFVQPSKTHKNGYSNWSYMVLRDGEQIPLEFRQARLTHAA